MTMMYMHHIVGSKRDRLVRRRIREHPRKALTFTLPLVIRAPSQLALHPGEAVALLLKHGNQAKTGIDARLFQGPADVIRN